MLPHGSPAGLQGRANPAREGDACRVARARARRTACNHAWRQGRSGDVCEATKMMRLRNILV